MVAITLCFLQIPLLFALRYPAFPLNLNQTFFSLNCNSDVFAPCCFMNVVGGGVISDPLKCFRDRSVFNSLLGLA